MITKEVITLSSTSSAVTGLRGIKSRISVPDKGLEDVYATVCAIFRQYDKAALLLPSYNTIEGFIPPFILLYMNKIQFKVLTLRDLWTSPAEFKYFRL
jgi:hypothetical protein